MNDLIASELSAIKINIRRPLIFLIILLAGGIILVNPFLIAVSLISSTTFVHDILSNETEKVRRKVTGDGRYYVVKFFSNLIITGALSFIIYRIILTASRLGLKISTENLFESFLLYFACIMVMNGVTFFLYFNFTKQKAKKTILILLGVLVVLIVVIAVAGTPSVGGPSFVDFIANDVVQNITLCFEIAALGLVINIILYIASYYYSRNKYKGKFRKVK